MSRRRRPSLAQLCALFLLSQPQFRPGSDRVVIFPNHSWVCVQPRLACHVMSCSTNNALGSVLHHSPVAAPGCVVGDGVDGDRGERLVSRPHGRPSCTGQGTDRDGVRRRLCTTRSTPQVLRPWSSTIATTGNNPLAAALRWSKTSERIHCLVAVAVVAPCSHNRLAARVGLAG